MRALPIIYFAYMFVSLYLLVLILLIYFKNRRTLFGVPQKTKDYSISVIIPAYNEEKTIESTVKNIFDIDYPNIVEVLVVNDGSIDGTLDILKSLLSKYKSRLKILNKKNSGKADSLNKALEFAKGELVVLVDADSYPNHDSFSKLVGYFDDLKVGAVTAACTPRNRGGFLEKLQVIEYKVIAFTRKLLDYIDSIYVTPGSLTVYRKSALKDIGGFDVNNITEDIEATWHLIHNGWKIRICLDSRVNTIVPSKVKQWYKQRKRWAIGGLQCLNKYKHCFMRKKGMLGFFIIPYFAIGLVLGLIGMGIFLYLFTKRFFHSYLLTKYSLDLGVPVITMGELFITPSVLNYLGVILFVLFIAFTFYVLAIMKDNFLEKQSFFNIGFYLIVYSLARSLLLIVGFVDILRGKVEWGKK
jgi:cellulose synthase/poly-beta-1,6-N-acetylglucosamine synthase-like glycosyltransferase